MWTLLCIWLLWLLPYLSKVRLLNFLPYVICCTCRVCVAYVQVLLYLILVVSDFFDVSTVLFLCCILWCCMFFCLFGAVLSFIVGYTLMLLFALTVALQEPIFKPISGLSIHSKLFLVFLCLIGAYVFEGSELKLYFLKCKWLNLRLDTMNFSFGTKFWVCFIRE